MYDNRAVKSYENGRTLHQQARLREAERAYRKAIKISPNFFEAHNNLGNILMERGRFKEAANSYRTALNLLHGHPMLLNNLGNAMQMQGNNEEALRHLDQALRREPDYADAHCNRGNALRGLQRIDDAVAAYRRAIQIDSDLAEAHNNLGNLLLEQEQTEAAIEHFRRAVQIDPLHREAFNGLGNALLINRNSSQAIEAYRHALSINPRHAVTHEGMGRALAAQNRYEEAVEAYRQAIELEPTYLVAYQNLAPVLGLLGNHAEVAEISRKLLELDPTYLPAYQNLGLALGYLGHNDEAIEIFRKLIDLDPDRVEAYRIITLNKKFSEYDDDLRAMEALYAREDNPDDSRMKLAFGLGKAFEDLGDYQKSMQFTLEANRLKRATYEYSIDESKDLFERIKQVYTPAFFNRIEGLGNQDPTPIFIVGMPRSGTTLVEQILASHPEVVGAGELDYLVTTLKLVTDSDISNESPEAVAGLDSDRLTNYGTIYLEKLRSHSGTARFITDKLPHNFMHIGFIHAILPRAKIIHLQRNPIDTCLSIFKHDFRTRHDYAYDQVELGKYYRLYLDLMAHWRRVLPDRVYDLRYETLIEDHEREVKRLLECCDLTWNDACLEFYKTERPVKTASRSQVRQPIYRDSIELWRRYETELAPLIATLG
ncbi:MAG: tetratricopeptide repeat protein [Gammaproteobacteria bacterium]|jgi:tetratricopeptide (TPR) repeat protein|nr:tetratricopeptide repeat protein [Gammaproteobacteria bacterium]